MAVPLLQQRLLWRNFETDRSPDIYCFQKVTFGDRPAGCIAVSALKATADMFSSINKHAADVLKNDTYMDDVASGDDSLQNAKALANDIQSIAEKGSFKFKKFTFSGDLDQHQKELPTEKVLGIFWSPTNDTIHLNVEMNHNKRKRGLRPDAIPLEEIPYSKRVCLRLVNGVFDPLGLYAPVTVKLKM